MKRALMLFFNGLLLLALLTACSKKAAVPSVSQAYPMADAPLAGSTPFFPYIDYYVSVLGNDVTGNGSLQYPYRHIQYAIDHAPAAGQGQTVRIMLLKGIYEENLVIKRSLVIRGAGTGKSTTWPQNPILPNEEVSTISRQIDDPVDPMPGIRIENAGTVIIQKLNIWGGGVSVTNTDFRMEGVEIQNSVGLFGVHLMDCPWFLIDASKIQTLPGVRADYAVFIEGSSGEINDTLMGDMFDHTINIVPTAPGEVIMPGQAFVPPAILIRNTQIAGSSIYYADGIRIKAPTNVEIYNTQITRSHANNEPAQDTSTVPHAGIEVSGLSTSGQPLVQIAGVNISGFNVGLGLVLEGYGVKVQDSNISGVSYDVWTAYDNASGAPQGPVDLGGGFFSSKGHNVFSADSPEGVYHQGPYKIDACWNDWQVAVSDIDPKRIYDQKDDGSLGRVRWDCGLSVNTSISRNVTVIKQSLCYAGPGEAYDVVSSLDQGQELPLLGLSENGMFYVVANPIFQDACWLPLDGGKYGGPLDQLTSFQNPPLPTPTPTPGSADPSTRMRATPTPGR